MEQLLGCAMDIGEQMLLSGAEVHRVEESIRRMCQAFGAARTDVFIITSSMVVTVYLQDGTPYTQTRRINGSSTDYEKLHQLNRLSRRICEQKLTLQQIRQELDAAVHCRTYPFWLECVCYAVIAGAFTLFFGGGVTEAAVSLLTGLAVRLCIWVTEKAVANKIFSKFCSAALATLLAFWAVRMGLIGTADQVIIGNIMTLIPGIGLTNALRDLFTGDSIAGLLRSVESILTALAIAAGYFLVAVLGGFVR